LDAWYQAQKQTINNFVPQSYRDGPLKRLLAEYNKNKDRIKQEAENAADGTTTTDFFVASMAATQMAATQKGWSFTDIAVVCAFAMIGTFIGIFVFLSRQSDNSETGSYALLA